MSDVKNCNVWVQNLEADVGVLLDKQTNAISEAIRDISPVNTDYIEENLAEISGNLSEMNGHLKNIAGFLDLISTRMK
jgi:hypothetical protein